MQRFMWSTMSRIHNIRNHLAFSTKTISCQQVKGDERRLKHNGIKGVIFDMGGVILHAPFESFKAYELKHNLPVGTIVKTIVAAGENGAWARLERGEVDFQEFISDFSQECSRVYGKDIKIQGLESFFSLQNVRYHEEIIEAVKCIRAEGIKTALLTNNWKFDKAGNSHIPVDKSLFDVIVESCQVGMRKPEPDIYKYTLDQLQLQPNECVFLDDIGVNLKAAKAMGIKTIKVSDPVVAVKDLGNEVDLDLRVHAEGTQAVTERLKIDLESLRTYLNNILNIHSEELPVVRIYEHGRSNPTYFVRHGNKNLVLRKKPPGKLLPSAHAIEREYRVMDALMNQGVPVPKMIGLCEDSSLIGTPFFIMEHVPGRVFKDPLLPGFTPTERTQIYDAMCEVLAKIHKVDINKGKLQDFGKQGNFMKRNFQRWAKQYEASKTVEIPAMNNLMQWLPERMPMKEKVTVIHGDFRLDNLIFHPTKPEVVAVIDWELSTIGDPYTDLATNLLAYYNPLQFPASGVDLKSHGIPNIEEYIQNYTAHLGVTKIENWEVYAAFMFFRYAAIYQGVYKRSLQGQSSSTSGNNDDLFYTKTIAETGWNLAKNSNIPPNIATNSTTGTNSKGVPGTRSYSTDTTMPLSDYINSNDTKIPGALPLSPTGLSPRAQSLLSDIKKFIGDHVISIEPEVVKWSQDPKTKWTVHPKIEELKKLSKSQGLWNLFMPKESDPECKYGAGLTNVEYAFMCEEMGKYPLAGEIFNCSAPDTGNMEVLVRYASDEIKEKYLKPLLNGEIRSCFGMTEPAVASSDATNIQSSIKRVGDNYIINGHKWWTSGAMDPRCKMCIFMGKTNTEGPIHKQQSMIVVPMDSPGVKIIRPLTVFGYDDAPHGHAEVLFENVKVPASHLLLGEGRGFEIAQGRLGPGRIHHCMRLIGASERALHLMLERVQNRIAFGKPLVTRNSIQHDIAKSRIEIEQCRLLVLKAAHMMDTVGNKVAAPEIAMIKVAAPRMGQVVIDRAIQSFGGMGVSGDTILAHMFAAVRTLRLADGPDEVHMSAVAKYEIRKHNLAKL